MTAELIAEGRGALLVGDASRARAVLELAIQGRRSGGKPFEDAMSAWHQERDARATPLYEFTSQMATLAPPPPEMQHLFAAIQGNRQAMDGFVSVISGALSPTAFFSQENVAQILAPAGSA
jgi:hypothetical protein